MFLQLLATLLLGAQPARVPAAVDGPTWEPLPSIPGPARTGDLRVAPDGELYVCYYAQYHAFVQRWTGSAWTPVGGQASCGPSWQNFLLFDQSSNILVASRDYDSPGNLNVQRKVGDLPWEVMNTAGVCPSYGSTFFENAHNPAGVFFDETLGLGPFGDKERLVLLILDGPKGAQRPTALIRQGSAWLPLGAPRFSDARASYLSLGVARGELWAAYSEDHQGGRVSLARYNRRLGRWQLKASRSVLAENTVLAEGLGLQVVIANDIDTSGRALRSYLRDGKKLVEFGGVIATGVDMGQQGWLQQVSTGKDSKQRLYVAYSYNDPASGLEGRIGISRLVRSNTGQLNWEVYTVAAPGIHEVRFLTMDIDPVTDMIYVGHTQASPGDDMDVYRIQITD